MKRTEDIVDYDLQEILDITGMNSSYCRNILIRVIKQGQIDAIKETVKECADAAETYEYNHLDACSECGHTATYVDKDSILSVADKLIKELE